MIAERAVKAEKFYLTLQISKLQKNPSYDGHIHRQGRRKDKRNVCLATLIYIHGKHIGDF